MKSIAASALLLLVISATPALAQDRVIDLTLWGSSVDFQGTNRFDDFFEMDLDRGSGLGLGVNVFLTERVSAELAAFELRSDAELAFADLEPLSMGRLTIRPVTLGAQYHFAGQSRFDPYIGAGAAWVSANDLESSDLDDLGIGSIELDDEFTYYANAGFGFHFTTSFGLALDARYIQYEPASRSKVSGGEEDLELSPLFVSVGLRLRF